MTANRIIQHIFQQPDIKQVDEAALERLVTSYPYFTAARLLLARKQYTVQKNLLAPAVKKAQQYSTNMHYFYRFVTTEEKSITPEVEMPVEAEPAPAPVQEIPVSVFPGEPETAAPSQQPVQDTKIHVTVPKAPAAEQPATPETSFTAPIYNTEEELTVTANDVVATPAATAASQAAPVTAAATGETQAATPAQEAAPAIAAITREMPAAAAPAQEPEAPATKLPLNTADREAEPIKIFPLDTSETEETSLTYQPLYTDDYFAYKRLKEPQQAEELNEKGAAEMKSFTSWLREMKHTFAEKASKQWYHQQMHRSYEDADPEVSEAVEKMAMESITLNDDIVSETLAEIWARQHQYQTAIHIYQKLSLLNPNKSAYFAQKIKELKLLTEKS
jgi:tetratricopeptide (TPR) repeat protein